MTTYADVKKQIAQLEKKAADLRKVEVAKVVANIREQMAKYELTVDDIAPGKPSKRGKPAVSPAKAKSGKPAKYMDPKTGKTWTGHGKAPGWIAAATNAGRRDDFLVDKVRQAKGAMPALKPEPLKVVTAKKASVVTKKAVTKKPKVATKKAPVTKKASAKAAKVPSAPKVKPATTAIKPATKAPAKTPVKAKAVSKQAAKPRTSMKPAKKATAKPAPATTEAKPAVAA